jgi:GDP-4-dehydro-6-deoxy-D-mannose reductase
MKTALITGAAGFCGRHLAERLYRGGDIRVVGLDAQPIPGKADWLHEQVCADLRDVSQTEGLIARTRPDFVFHLAGALKGRPLELYQANLMSGISVIEALRTSAPQARVLVVGSAAEYGSVPECRLPIKEDEDCVPTDAYGLSKFALTCAALSYSRHYGMKVVVARPFNIIGAGMPPNLVLGAILQRAKSALRTSDDPEVTVGNLEAVRDFVAVEDVVAAYIRLLQGDHWGQVFNICSGEPRSIRSVVQALLAFSRHPIRLRVDPSLMRCAEVQVAYGSWHKASQAFGFVPAADFDRTLEAAWRWAMDE